MPLFGQKEDPENEALRQQVAAAHEQIADLQGWIHQLRDTPTTQLEKDLRDLQQAVKQTEEQRAAGQAAADRTTAELADAHAQLVETREQAALQEVGIYEYAHPLDDALAYADALARLRGEIKAAAKEDAVSCQVDWAINGSIKEGQRMGRDIAKLVLRAYNTEADNAVRSVKPNTRDTVKSRLTKTRDTIAKLGALLRIAISADYHRLRLREVDLTADYLMKVEVEKEAERAERDRLREEAKVIREIERERARLAKERAHYEAAAMKLRTADGDPASLAQLEAKLAELDAALRSVDARAANIRTGYVYVISNVGAFGADVVKIGMTRRLQPMDRVRELGDASVPFRFDCHALFFSEDAVSLENALHERFADRRVNLVNMRREFFYATAEQVREALVELGSEHILEYTAEAPALEWRASHPSRRPAVPAPRPAGQAEAAPSPMPAAVTSGGADLGDGDLSDDGDLD